MSFAIVRQASATWMSTILALAFVLAIAAFNDYRSVFEIDPDESNNLIKALLLEHGARFGGEMWSDQPPLFSYLLVALFRLFGSGVNQARTFVLVFSGLAVFAVVDVVRRLGGPLHALGAFLLLVGSTYYVQLSVSVMIGLPSVAFLALATWAFVRAVEKRTALGAAEGWGWLFASGLLLGASLGTKLFTAFMFGPLVLAVALAEFLRPGRRGTSQLVSSRFLLAGKAAGLVVFAASLSLGLALFPVLGANGSELVDAHVGLRTSQTSLFIGLEPVMGFLHDDAALYTLALFGTIAATVRRKHVLHLHTAWLLLAAVALSVHFPVWPHHRILLTVPAAVLAGFGLGEGALLVEQRIASLLPRMPQPRLAGSLAALAVVVLAGCCAVGLDSKRLTALRRPHTLSNSAMDWEIQRVFDEYAASANWVVTSRPIFAFRSSKPVPPALAVTSWKRFQSALLPAEQVVRELRKYRPEVVLLTARWPPDVRTAVQYELRETYHRVWSQPVAEIWIRDGG